LREKAAKDRDARLAAEKQARDKLLGHGRDNQNKDNLQAREKLEKEKALAKEKEAYQL